MSIANLTVLPEKRATFDRISLRRLVLIRWVAIAGQAVTLLVVHYAFGFELELLLCFGIVFCSVLLNPAKICSQLFSNSGIVLL